MAQVDVEWPSEDEDFDAVADSGKSRKTAVKDSPSVSQDVEESETPETESPATTEPEAEVAPAEPTPAEPEATEEPEPASPEEGQPETEALAETAPEAATEASAADQPPVVKVSRLPSDRKPLLRLVAEAVLVVAVLGLGLWGWNLSSENSDLKTQVASLNANPQVAVQKQTEALIAQVSKLIDLPSGETPTIANVTDASAAKKQSAFFNSAENGDKVLMYVKAGEAILYRPSTHKIVLVAPLTFTSNTATTPTTKK